MIIALIGLDKGLINQDVYVTIILMSLLTTVATPVILRKLMNPRKGPGDQVRQMLQKVIPRS